MSFAICACLADDQDSEVRMAGHGTAAVSGSYNVRTTRGESINESTYSGYGPGGS